MLFLVWQRLTSEISAVVIRLLALIAPVGYVYNYAHVKPQMNNLDGWAKCIVQISGDEWCMVIDFHAIGK